MFSEADNAVASVIESYEIVERGQVPIWSISPSWRNKDRAEDIRSTPPPPTPSRAPPVARTPSSTQGAFPSRMQGVSSRGGSVPPSFLEVTASRGASVFTFEQFCQDKLFPSF
jgi:hypothetical protein